MERRARLRSANDMRLVYKEGRAWKHSLLVLIVCPNGLGLTRVGVVASKKVGGAVVRNRAKRLMREAARHLYPRLSPGWDVILIARGRIVGVGETEVEKALVSLVEEAGLVS